jgi:type II secretory pathway component PulC
VGALASASTVASTASHRVAANPQSGAPASAVPSVPIELLGIMLDAPPAKSSCLVRCTRPAEARRTAVYEVGDTACDVVEIRQILADAIVVRIGQTGRVERLTFAPSSGARGSATDSRKGAVAPATVERATSSALAVELPRASLEHHLADLSALLSSLVATPHAAAIGGVDGFEVSQIKTGSLAEQLGLQNGDVVQEVNGERLDSVAAAIRVFGRAQTLKQVTLAVSRGNQALTVVVNVK